MLLSAGQCIHNHKVNVWSAHRGVWTIIIHSYVESHNLYLFFTWFNLPLISRLYMYTSMLSKLNLILMIWFHRLYDMLTSLLFRLSVINLIFLPSPSSFFFFISKHHLLKVKASLGKQTPPVGGAPATSLKPSRTEHLLFSKSMQSFLFPTLHVHD